MDQNAKDIMRAAGIARQYGLAVAVKQGKAQLQHVTYAANGTPTIEALTDYIDGAAILRAVIDRTC